VPVSTAHRAVPTGHGVRESVRDKGLLWVFNQSMRVGAYARLKQEVKASSVPALVVEPEPNDVLLFLHNPVNLAARRAILEYAYKTTKERTREWIAKNESVAERFRIR